MLKTKINTLLKGVRYYLITFLFCVPRLRIIRKLFLRIKERKRSGFGFQQVFYVFNKDVGWLYVDGTQNYVFAWNYEGNVVKLIKSLSERYKGLFVDIGAYVGFYTIMFAKRGWRVLAFEPNPISYKILRLNILTHKVEEKVTTFMRALGSKDGIATFTISLSPAESSFTSYLRRELRFLGINVNITTLDAIISELSNELRDYKTMLLKIDVEGYGLEVIRGSITTIKTFRPYIILEVHRTFDETDELKAVKLLRDLGYKYKVIEYRSNKNFILFLYPDTESSFIHT